MACPNESNPFSIVVSLFSSWPFFFSEEPWVNAGGSLERMGSYFRTD